MNLPQLDLHTHSIASGHASVSTITDMARSAKEKGLSVLGIADHGPATVGSATSSYFRSLACAPKIRCGVRVLYGVELNILDYDGRVDLADEILNQLDYSIASIHLPNLKPGTVEENTSAYIGAMKHPNVRIIGHWDDARYPVDHKKLVSAAVRHQVLLEINNSSLSPDGYRGETRANNLVMLALLKDAKYPVILSSDSHGAEHVGDVSYAAELLRESGFPEELVLDAARIGKYLRIV